MALLTTPLPPGSMLGTSCLPLPLADSRGTADHPTHWEAPRVTTEAWAPPLDVTDPEAEKVSFPSPTLVSLTVRIGSHSIL